MSFEARVATIIELGFSPSGIDSLQGYVQHLWAANEDLNLFSRQMSFEELIDNHVIDCLLPLKLFPANVKVVADFGSGGGMPGILYALAFPEIQFQLFEKSPKKQRFLKSCQRWAPNVQVFGEIPQDLPGVSLVTARAFKPLDVILEMSRLYYERGGQYFLLKGRKEKIDEEILLARKKFKTLEVQIQSLKSPVLEVERHLLLLGKV